MERYAPTAKDLASRDVVSRSMTLEIREGRGVGPEKDHIYLQLCTHLPKFFTSVCPVFRRPLLFLLVSTSPRSPSRSCQRSTTTWVVFPHKYTGEVLTVDENGNDKVVPGLYACW